MTRLSESGRRQVIAFACPGDIIGFPSEGCYHCDCEALIDSGVISFPVSYLKDPGDRPELHKMLLEAALDEIGALQDHFMMLGQKSAVEKVASFLCDLEDRIGHVRDGGVRFSLNMPRADIADFIGLTTETVSRTLTQLRKCGVIEIENIQTVIVLKPEALRALAEGDG